MNFKQRQRHYRRSLRMALYRLGVRFQMLTARKRALPDFLIAGAQKGGTTTLYAYLVQHPNILPTFDRKEVHYWDNLKNYNKGELWYRAHFPLQAKLKVAAAITGEKTPNYLENPEYIKKIKKDLPAVKLIILLRNPIERTISNYYMIKGRGDEELPLLEALLQEEERLANPKEIRKFGTERAYKLRSIYAPSIKTCLDLFSPDQVLILDSKKFFTAPSEILKEIYNLLGVSMNHMPDLTIHRNLGVYEKDDIPENVYTYLRDFFGPHNEELYAILGRNFGWDKNLP